MSKPKFIEELESFSGKTVVKVFVNKAFKIEQTYRTSDKEMKEGNEMSKITRIKGLTKSRKLLNLELVLLEQLIGLGLVVFTLSKVLGV